MGIYPVLDTRIGKDAYGHRMLEAMGVAGLPIDGVKLDCLHPAGEVHVELEEDGLITEWQLAGGSAT